MSDHYTYTPEGTPPGTQPGSPVMGGPQSAPPPRRRHTRRRRSRVALYVIVPILVVVAAIAATIAVVATRSEEKAKPGRAEAEAFLAAWTAGDTAKMQTLVSDPNAPVAKDVQEVMAPLKAQNITYTVDDVQQAGEGKATATFTAKMFLPGLADWSYQGSLPLKVGEDTSVKIVWSRAAIHPALSTGQKLDKTRVRAERGAILGADGQPLIGKTPSITIVAIPGRIKDRAALNKALQDNVGLDPAAIDRSLKQSWVKADSEVPLTAIRRDAYDRIKPAIYDVPGLQFQASYTRLAPSDTFAKHLLGRTAPITGDQLKALGPLYIANDEVGQTGLEAAYEKQLAGTPSGDVHIVEATSKPGRKLQEFAGTAPVNVKTTIDVKTQTAIELALAGVDRPAAFVAVDRDGNIRGAASRPLNEEFNRALLGQYPPGSTFKIVTTDALLSSGLNAGSPLSCPPSITVGGRPFRNSEGEAAGQLSLADAFATSCNTAFIGASQKLPVDQFSNATKQFGFGIDYSVGLATKGGSVPPPADKTEEAADSIGQGKVVASPLQMATVGATVLSGQWKPPVLVTDPAPPPPPNAAPVQALDPNVQLQLNTLMHGVVARGTGTKAAVLGKDIAGKTGTAEFGPGNPPQTHAWFVGIEPTMAVAAIVEGGGFGGDVAAPIVAKFYSARG